MQARHDGKTTPGGRWGSHGGGGASNVGIPGSNLKKKTHEKRVVLLLWNKHAV